MIARLVLGVGAVLAAAGCHSVRAVWEPEAFLARSKPALVYVRYGDHPAIAVANPRLVGDTLRGTEPDGSPVAVPWDDVRDVYARRLHGARTMFAVSSVTLLSAITVYAFVQGANGNLVVTCETPASSAYEHDRDVECGR